MPDHLPQSSEPTLLVTKLALPPIRSDLVARPRLLNLLQQSLQRPFTLIAAPAGFGKTTLLSSWLEQAPVAAAWVSLEHGDDDPARFWFYVISALENVQPGSGASALALLRGADPQQLPPMEAILTMWINSLAAHSNDVI